MKKPSVFSWLDLLTFGLPALIMLALAVVVSFLGSSLGAPAPVYIVTWACALGFAGLYVTVLAWKSHNLRRGKLTVHGISYINDGHGPSLDQFELDTSRAVYIWDMSLSPDEAGDRGGAQLLADSGVTIIMKLRASRDSRYTGLKGRAYGKHWIVPSNKSSNALIHTLLHVMYEEWSGVDDLDHAHEFMKRRGMP